MSDPFTNREVVYSRTRSGHQQVFLRDGRAYARHIDRFTGRPLTQWNLFYDTFADPSNPDYLHLIIKSTSPGKPKQWLLFICAGNSKDSRGLVWRIKGTEYGMRTLHAENRMALGSERMETSFTLNENVSKHQILMVKEALNTETWAVRNSRENVKGKCQALCVRVLRSLAYQGIMTDEAVDEIEGCMDPIEESSVPK